MEQQDSSGAEEKKSDPSAEAGVTDHGDTSGIPSEAEKVESTEVVAGEGSKAGGELGVASTADTVESTHTDTVESTPTDTVESTHTDTVESTHTDTVESTHTDTVESTHTVESTPTHKVEYTDTVESTPINTIESTSIDTIKSTPTDKVESIPTDKVESTPTDTVEATPTYTVESTPTDTVESTPTDKVEPTDTVESTPTDKVESTPTDKVESTPTDKVEPTPTDKVESTPTSAVTVEPTSAIKVESTPTTTVTSTATVDPTPTVTVESKPPVIVESAVTVQTTGPTVDGKVEKSPEVPTSTKAEPLSSTPPSTEEGVVSLGGQDADTRAELKDHPDTTVLAEEEAPSQSHTAAEAATTSVTSPKEDSGEPVTELTGKCVLTDTVTVTPDSVKTEAVIAKTEVQESDADRNNKSGLSPTKAEEVKAVGPPSPPDTAPADTVPTESAKTDSQTTSSQCNDNDDILKTSSEQTATDSQKEQTSDIPLEHNTIADAVAQPMEVDYVVLESGTAKDEPMETEVVDAQVEGTDKEVSGAVSDGHATSVKHEGALPGQCSGTHNPLTEVSSMSDNLATNTRITRQHNQIRTGKSRTCFSSKLHLHHFTKLWNRLNLRFKISNPDINSNL